MVDKIKIIVAHENIFQSIIKDGFSFLSLCLSMWFGVWVGSGWLQFIIGVTWIIVVLAFAVKYAKKDTIFSFDDAHKRLNDIERQYK